MLWCSQHWDIRLQLHLQLSSIQNVLLDKRNVERLLHCLNVGHIQNHLQHAAIWIYLAGNAGKT